MRQAFLVIFSLFVLTLAGCPPRPGDDGSMQGRMPKAPREAPPPPPLVSVALDPALAAAADRELTQELGATDPILRVHALEAIRQSGATQHSKDILLALNDHEARVRFAAALAAGELRLSEAHEPLLALADDVSENVRVAVRFALHRLGDKHLSHDLEKMAADSNPLVRGNTAMVLGLLGEPSALPLLRVLRQDSNPAVRQNASEAMWRLRDEDGMKDLIGLTLSSFHDDQAIGYMGLAWPRDTRVRQHVRAGLAGEEGPEIALIAARAMGLLGRDEGYVIAENGAKSSDSRQRVLAALAFGAIGRCDAQTILKKLLSDSEPDVRIAAAAAILQLKPA
jgi:HEAT repeat protein